MTELICPICKCPFVCHRLAINKQCPNMSKNCKCDSCDPSIRLDHDCHTLLKGRPREKVIEKVLFT